MGLNVEKVDLKECCCVREESGCFSKGNGKEFVQYLQLCRVPNRYCRRCANDEHAPIPHEKKLVRHSSSVGKVGLDWWHSSVSASLVG